MTIAVTRPRHLRIPYGTILAALACLVTIGILLVYRRSLAGMFTGLRGGSYYGLAFAYAGSVLLVAAQFYTIVKRSGWIAFIKTMGGGKTWLTIHIALSFLGLVAVLVHAGFPYRFRYDSLFDHGLAGLTTWLLVATAASGVFGRYIYRRLPAMRKLFSYWKPTHIFVTGLLFFAAVVHMTTAFGG